MAAAGLGLGTNDPPKILHFFIITTLASFIEIFKEGRLISKLAGRKLLVFILPLYKSSSIYETTTLQGLRKLI